MNNFHKFQKFEISAIFEFVFANLIENRQTSLFSGIWREIREKIHQKFAEKCKIRRRKCKKSEIQLFNRENNLAIFDEKIEIREWFSSFFGIRFQNGAKECIV